MPTTEDLRHDLLLIITVALFIFLATGFLGPGQITDEETVVFP
ncbi:MAG: hypothetical protein A4E53_04356 [Pelotomaculum sp. PtaB.Bin104]|nr:MAG: hypothetical protein A4E53_04356 [Pelotomaculum sp. PtaB.Bin104]